jgi:hypothetical protein
MEPLAAPKTGNICTATSVTDFIDERDRSCGSPVVTSEEEVQHCMDHVASTTRRHHHHRFRSFNMVVPKVPSQLHSADNFASIERLRQHIPSGIVAKKRIGI